MGKKLLSFWFAYCLIISLNSKAQSFQWGFGIGNSSDQYVSQSATDNLGNKYIIGTFSGSNMDVDPSINITNLSSSGSTDIFVAKYSSTGAFINAFKIGGTDNDAGLGICTDNANNIYITGWFRGVNIDFDPSSGVANLTSNGDVGTDMGYNGEVFVAKYNSSLQYQWAFNLGGPTINDAGLRIKTDNSSNVYVSGSFSGTNVDFDPSISNTAYLSTLNGNRTAGFLAKYDTNGSYIWAKVFASINTLDGGIRNFDFDTNGNVYATGQIWGETDIDPGTGTNIQTSNGESDIFLVKLSSAGNYIWGFKIGGTAMDIAWGLAVNSSNEVLITGLISSSGVDFNPGVGTNNLSTSGGEDIFVAKYDQNGNYIFAFNLGGSGLDGAYDIAPIPNAAGFSITGYFSGTVDFNPGIGVSNLTSAGGKDIFIARYDNNGNYVKAFKVGGSADDYGRSVSNTASTTIVTGDFSGTNIDFDPSINTANLTSNGGSDGFVANYDFSSVLPTSFTYLKCFLENEQRIILNWETSAEINTDHYDIEYSVNGNSFTKIGQQKAKGNSISSSFYQFIFNNYVNGVNYFRLKLVDKDNQITYSSITKIDIKKTKVIEVYPNPVVNETLNIKLSGINNTEKMRLQIVNQAGQVLLDKIYANTSLININVTQLAKGNYFIKLIHDNEISSVGFIKQ